MSEEYVSADEPGDIISDLLASKLYHDFEHYGRRDLYIWELRACRFLLDQLEAHTFRGSLWTADFIRLNHAEIRAGKIRMNFNLRAASRMANEPRA